MINICQADMVFWEAICGDGTYDREVDGKKYTEIDRDNLKIFKLVGPSGLIFQIEPPEGMTGQNLVYRRRMVIKNGKRIGKIGIWWIPLGPFYLIDPELGEITTALDLLNIPPELSLPIPMDGETFFQNLVGKNL